jgi:hypothetical protein
LLVYICFGFWFVGNIYKVVFSLGDMKKRFGLFFLVGLFLIGVVSAACPGGIVSYWGFDEGGGVVASDSFGSNDGALLSSLNNQFGVAGGWNADIELLPPEEGFSNVGKSDSPGGCCERVFVSEFMTADFPGWAGPGQYLYMFIWFKGSEFPAWEQPGTWVKNPTPDPNKYQLYILESDGQNVRNEYFRMYYTATTVGYFADPVVLKEEDLPFYVVGKSGNALNFDGASDHVEVGNDPSLDMASKEVTLSAWIKLTGNSRTGVHRIIRIGEQITFGVNDNSNKLGGYVTDGGSQGAWDESDYVLSDDTWYHVVMVLDESGSKVYYVNGNPEATIGSGYVIDGATGVTRIGMIGDGTGAGDHPFNGLIDEVLVFDRALSGGEVDALYQKGLNGLGACECSSSDVIMKLSSSSNAHGALWNDVNYGYDVCYSDIFGVIGGGNRVCSGANKVVGLSSASNAHAEEPSRSAYPNNICYGGLDCQYVSGACPVDYPNCVVTLYSEGNSHLASCDPAYAYPNKICCNDEGWVPSGPSVLEWRDMDGNVIVNAEVEDTVAMVKTNYIGGGIFEIWEEDAVFDDDIRVGADAIDGGVSGSDLIGYWTITAEDLAKTFDNTDFYFKVDGGENKSGYLSISSTANDAPTFFDFVSPPCGYYFDVGSDVEIIVVAEDPDDLISGNVSVAGSVFPFGNGGIAFNYTFDYPGNFQVVVEAIDSGGDRFRKVASVMSIDPTVDGDYAAACIDEPEDFSNIDTSEVWFNASSSLGIRHRGAVDNEVRPGDVGGLNFYWTFSDGRTNLNVDGSNELSYLFYKRFAVAGDNWAVLNVELI